MSAWAAHRVGDVLLRSESWITIVPDVEYKEVTVRIWGKGVVPRGSKLGSEIGSSKRLRVEAGQFIVSRIDARHGAFGVIPKELNGAVVTNDFPVFTPNPAVLEAAFLEWLSKTPGFVDACRQASEGTTNRVRLREVDLIKKGGKLSSKPLENALNDIRKNFTPSLGKDHGRVVLK